jgi:hypothetical protein
VRADIVGQRHVMVRIGLAEGEALVDALTLVEIPGFELHAASLSMRGIILI